MRAHDTRNGRRDEDIPEPYRLSVATSGVIRRYWEHLACGTRFDSQADLNRHRDTCDAPAQEATPVAPPARTERGGATVTWTDELDRRLRELWASPRSVDEIATELGLARGAVVRNRVSYMRKQGRWAPELDARRAEVRSRAATPAAKAATDAKVATETVEPAVATFVASIPPAVEPTPAAIDATEREDEPRPRRHRAHFFDLWRAGTPVSLIASACGLGDAATVWAEIRAMRQAGEWPADLDQARTEAVNRERRAAAARPAGPDAERSSAVRYGPAPRPAGQRIEDIPDDPRHEPMADVYLDGVHHGPTVHQVLRVLGVHVPMDARRKYLVSIRVTVHTDAGDGVGR